MRHVRLVALLLVAFVVQMSAGGSVSRSPEPRSSASQSVSRQIAGGVSARLRQDVLALPPRLRPDAEALLSAVLPNEKLRLIEKLGDSSLDSVGDLFADLALQEQVASVRLELVNWLIRNVRPKLRPVFHQLANSDPDPAVAVAAIEGLRAVEVLKVREVLTRRFEQSRSDSAAFQVFAEADERWISLVHGTMLPAFLRVPPPRFSVNEQNSVRVVAFGDFGIGSPEQKQVAAAMLAHHRQSPFDCGITVGDNFYDDGMYSWKDPRWKTQWEDLYGPLQISFYAVLGNHDWHLFDSPAAEILYRTQSWRMPAPYYTFVAGPVQFFALDTNDVSQKQLGWLDEELKKSRSTWKVVYGHHAIYSDGYHGDNSRLRDQLLPVLKDRVNIYIAGHEHDLQHLKPEGGVHFLVSGGGGKDLRPVEPTNRSLFAKEESGFTILEANQSTLNIEFVSLDSKMLHQYELHK